MLLVRWYDHTKWLLERVDSFPKNQRFIFGTRMADTTLDIMELKENILKEMMQQEWSYSWMGIRRYLVSTGCSREDFPTPSITDSRQMRSSRFGVF